MSATDIRSIVWQPWANGGNAEVCDVLGMAESWLADFGLGLLPDSSSRPDAWAKLDADHFAFRLDSLGKSVVVLVAVQWDADVSGEAYRNSSWVNTVEVHRV